MSYTSVDGHLYRTGSGEHARAERRAERRRLEQLESEPAPRTTTMTKHDRSTRLMDIAKRYGSYSLFPQATAEGWTATEFEARSIQYYRRRSAPFKLRHVFNAAATKNPFEDGLERDLLLEWDPMAVPQRFALPWTELARYMTRDMTVAAGSGSLVETDNLPAADILRPWSVAARAGITIVENLVGNQALPKTTAKATINWHSTEASAPSTSTPTLAQLVGTAKTASATVNLSRHFTLQTDFEPWIRRELMRTAGTAIDQAIFNGSGAAGQPFGIIGTPGIGTQSGTSLAHTGATAMKTSVSNANAMDDTIAFVATPTVRGLLEGRERATGLGFIWDKGQIASVPGYATTDLPAGTMICGSWPALYLLLWGPGIVVEFNPFGADAAAFRAGIIQARVIVSCDVIVAHPAAFNLASSIT
jgi:hypothetical protein